MVRTAARHEHRAALRPDRGGQSVDRARRIAAPYRRRARCYVDPMSDQEQILDGPVELASDRDARLFQYRVTRGNGERNVFVSISGTLMACASETLAIPLNAIMATKGRSAVEDSLRSGRNAAQITVNAMGAWEDPTP